MADGTLYHENSKHELTGYGEEAHTLEDFDKDDLNYILNILGEVDIAVPELITTLTPTLLGTELFRMLQDISMTYEIVQRAQEVVRQPEGEHGHFYRYVSVDDLERLLTEGVLQFDGRRAFDRVVSDKQINPEGLSPERMIAFQFLRIIDKFIASIETEILPILTDADPWLIVEKIEAELSAKDGLFAGLTELIKKACQEKSTSALIEFLRQAGGDNLMILLERSGWDVRPHGAFSDLMPLSAGAPLMTPIGNRPVFLQLSFDRNELLIPEKDWNNEHEVMVRRITLDNLRGVFWERNWKELRSILEDTYPEYFRGQGAEALLRFAQQKPLAELLVEMGVLAISSSIGSDLFLSASGAEVRSSIVRSLNEKKKLDISVVKVIDLSLFVDAGGRFDSQRFNECIRELQAEGADLKEAMQIILVDTDGTLRTDAEIYLEELINNGTVTFMTVDELDDIRSGRHANISGYLLENRFRGKDVDITIAYRKNNESMFGRIEKKITYVAVDGHPDVASIMLGLFYNQLPRTGLLEDIDNRLQQESIIVTGV